MAVLYGAKLWQESRCNGTDLRYDTIGKNSEVFADGDPVTIASGVLKVVAAATDPIVGVVEKKQTMTSDNQTVAKVYPGFTPSFDGTIFLMGTNSDLTGNATNDATYYGLTGSTGAVQVNVSSGVTTTSSAQVEIVKVDPRNIGGSGSGSGLREVLVKFIRTPSVGGVATN